MDSVPPVEADGPRETCAGHPETAGAGSQPASSGDGASVWSAGHMQPGGGVVIGCLWGTRPWALWCGDRVMQGERLCALWCWCRVMGHASMRSGICSD